MKRSVVKLMITNGVGSVLRQIRKSRGESIVEVAKATHTSPASFTKWENDQTIPSERSIRKLAEYYQTDPLELLGVAYPDKYAKQQEQEKQLQKAQRSALKISSETIPFDLQRLAAFFRNQVTRRSIHCWSYYFTA